jgi:hypothetical protein
LLVSFGVIATPFYLSVFRGFDTWSHPSEESVPLCLLRYPGLLQFSLRLWPLALVGGGRQIHCLWGVIDGIKDASKVTVYPAR